MCSIAQAIVISEENRSRAGNSNSRLEGVPTGAIVGPIGVEWGTAPGQVCCDIGSSDRCCVGRIDRPRLCDRTRIMIPSRRRNRPF